MPQIPGNDIFIALATWLRESDVGDRSSAGCIDIVMAAIRALFLGTMALLVFMLIDVAGAQSRGAYSRPHRPQSGRAVGLAAADRRRHQGDYEGRHHTRRGGCDDLQCFAHYRGGGGFAGVCRHSVRAQSRRRVRGCAVRAAGGHRHEHRVVLYFGGRRGVADRRFDGGLEQQQQVCAAGLVPRGGRVVVV